MPSPGHALRACVLQSLNYYQYENATFLAERHHAEVGTAESLYLLATCYFRDGQTSRAYSVLKGCVDVECRFLFAKACLILEKLQEGELALTGGLYPGASVDISDFNHTAGAAYELLGDLCRRAGRTERSSECYHKALTQNSTLWSCFAKLSELGVDLDCDAIFNTTNITATIVAAVPTTVAFKTPKTAPIGRRKQPLIPQPAGNVSSPLAASTTIAAANNTDTNYVTPGTDYTRVTGPGSTRQELAIPTFATTPSTPMIGSFSLAGGSALVPTGSALGSPLPFSYATPSPSGTMGTPGAAPPLSEKVGIPTQPRKSARLRGAISVAESPPVLRRSGRLFTSRGGSSSTAKLPPSSSKAASKESKRKGRIAPQVDHTPEILGTHASAEGVSGTATTPAGSRAKGGGGEGAADTKSPAATQPPGVPPIRMDNVARTSIAATLQLLNTLGRAILAIARYDCEDAISILQSLPHQQFNTGWTQTQIGKAFFEMADYKASDQAFRMARRIEPHRVGGMELYSTVLWHLRKETALSYLAHEVIAGDRQSQVKSAI